MKKILLIALLVGAMLSVTAYVTCVAVPLLGKNVKGSGHIVTKTVPAPDFNAIDASRAVKVVVSDTASEIRIEADDNLIDMVVVRPVKGRLEVTLDKEVKSISNANVTVTVPANGKIRSLDASSASKISYEGVFETDRFSIDASSAAKIDARVKTSKCSIDASSAAKIKASVEAAECSIEASSASKIEATLTATSCSVSASSAAKIELDGTADALKADLSSAAKLSAGEFTAVNATVGTSSGSGAEIGCSGKLTADASSGSSIRYKGDCQVSAEKSSGGSVRKE